MQIGQDFLGTLYVSVSVRMLPGHQWRNFFVAPLRYYCISKKTCPLLYSDSLYENGQHFFALQHEHAVMDLILHILRVRLVHLLLVIGNLDTGIERPRSLVHYFIVSIIMKKLLGRKIIYLTLYYNVRCTPNKSTCRKAEEKVFRSLSSTVCQ